MTTCIVINGWHNGHVVDLPRPLPTLRLPRPAVTTYCDDYDDEWRSAAKVEDYQLAFRSIDGKIALYTVDGASDSLIKGRDWISPKNGYDWKGTPLYVGCHDPRAIFEDSEAHE